MKSLVNQVQTVKMTHYFVALLAIVISSLLISCEQEDSYIISHKRVLITEPTLQEMEVWVDPFAGTTKRIPAFRGQWQDDKSHQGFAVDQYSHYGISGFEFEEGYIFKLSVKESSYKDPPTDFLNRWYELDKIISKTKAK